MIAVGKHLFLPRQERTAGIHEVNAWQVVLLRNFLRPQVFLDGQRIVRATFDGGIVGDDHALDTVYAPHAADDSGRGYLVVVDFPGRQLADFEERRVLIKEGTNPFAGQHLAARYVTLSGALAAALHHLLAQRREILRERLVHREVGGKVVRIAIDLGLDQGHLRSRVLLKQSGHGPVASKSSRPISMRRISLVPAPIS